VPAADPVIEVRLASASDVPGALAVFVAAQQARSGRRPAPDLVAALGGRVRRAAAEGRLLVAVERDDAASPADPPRPLVGTALTEPARADDGAGPPIPGLEHVSLVMVRPDRWGRGVGQQLVAAVLDLAGRRGAGAVQLWVHADNPRGAALYRRAGFRPSGREQVDEHGERLLHLGRSLDRDAATSDEAGAGARGTPAAE
jgi:GNAT superfamily N-acetyltransferase